MPAASDYQAISLGEWRVMLRSALWNLDLQKNVFELVDRQPWAKHPQTLLFRSPSGAPGTAYYLKVFHPSKGSTALKDVFRSSKALRAWRQGLALNEAGFEVPLTIAVGEQRRFRILRRAFLLTRGVDAEPLHIFLHGLLESGESKVLLARKREELKRLAGLIRQFHFKGFVHGDLVASNILVADGNGRAIFYLMDNDRTRHYPCWLPQSLWRRNLVQLNRMPLPGITLQDRMRFFHAYRGTRQLTNADRDLARWLERQTRRRRQECDGAEASGDFRRLMSWSPHFRKSSDVPRFG
jgi:hypothetical protein